MHRIIYVVAFAIILAIPATAEACYSWQIFTCGEGKRQYRDGASKPTQVIRNKHRERVGDIYDGGDGRLQIRNNHREIQGYIEPSGRVTDSRRQPIGRIEGLPKRYWHHGN